MFVTPRHAASLAFLLLALLADGAKAKALFRRSKAQHSLGKVEVAYADISEAKKIDPSDKAVQAHYSLVYKQYRDIKKQEHEAAKTLWKGKLSEPTAETASTGGNGNGDGNGGGGAGEAKGGSQRRAGAGEGAGAAQAVSLPPSFFASIWDNVIGRFFGSVWKALFGRSGG